MRNLNQFADLTAGVVYIHAAPVALCPHVEWALSSTLDARADLSWAEQPAEPGRMRAVADWSGPVGTAAALASALRAWPSLVFEVTEDPSEGVDGERFSHVPDLGLWRGSTSANGDVVIGEMQLRALMAAHPDGAGLAAELDGVLGTAWDEALEDYRMGAASADVTLLERRVG